MSKMNLGMQIVIFFFILFLVISAVSSYMLIHIKKTKYKILYEEDKLKVTYWKRAETLILQEAVWHKPHWVRDNKNAKFWLLIYELSFLIAMLFLGLPFILALFGIYLFD